MAGERFSGVCAPKQYGWILLDCSGEASDECHHETKRALQRRAQRKVNDYVFIRNKRRVRAGLAGTFTSRNKSPTAPPRRAHLRTCASEDPAAAASKQSRRKEHS